MNSTSVLGHRATSAELYASSGVEFSKLGWLEYNWAAWYLWIGDPVIATGLMSFLLHEIVYFGRCLPWMIIDATPYFRRWKLQPNKIPTVQEQWECTKLVLYSHFTIELPQIWFFHPIASACGMNTWQVPFPNWQTAALQVALFFVFEDAFHFFAHRALHYGPLYKHIHKVHHKYSAPFGLAAEYAHPAEVFILGMGTIGGPLLYCLAGFELHMVTVLVWVTLKLFQAVDAHSGYDFPWSLNRIIPFWSGADHHDFHHMAFVNNFSTSFRWLDHWFGTDDKYLAYKKRLATVAAKDRAALEKRLLEEAEKEGILAADEAEKKRLF
ncbi:C-4 methyl sterol oxidase [Rhizoctonia solani AG-1 IA]|uniref:C-4 methyl sterol oxidase n=1 Tax=Thanatephorus cucumeris (strain AG1-IA) TaxID=983506 RepID=L8WQ33_THACA|nr:C-4 methyl sterol oxidase [Rhizoctonia solani AG-1 IA]